MSRREKIVKVRLSEYELRQIEIMAGRRALSEFIRTVVLQKWGR